MSKVFLGRATRRAVIGGIIASLAAAIAPQAAAQVSAMRLATVLRGGGATLTAPYNNLVTPGPGDSRTAQAGGLVGTYGLSSGVINNSYASGGSGGGPEAYTPMLLANQLRWINVPNPGIGGATAVQSLAYPRPVTLTPCTGRIDNGTAGNAGNTLTISVSGGGDPIIVGCRIMGTGATPCFVTAVLTGSGGVGTYTVDGAAQNIASTATIQPQYVYGQVTAKTIADIAANNAAIVFLWVGTNDATTNSTAAALVAVDTAIRGLTDPTYSYPGYGGPLPLYNGVAKTVVLLNETRRGITTTGTTNLQFTGTTASQFAAYATNLKRYSFDSGNATYANPHVVVVDTFNDPTLADLTDTTTFNPLPGIFADGLHGSAPGLFAISKVIAARIGPLLPAYNFAVLPTTVTAANFYSQNPCFTTTTGGTSSLNSHTLVGNVPLGWRLIAPSGSGLTFTCTYNALGGNLGNEWVIRITGTPSVSGTCQFDTLSTTAQKAAVNVATDTMRAMGNIKLAIAAGSVTLASIFGTLGTAPNSMMSTIGGSGNSTGYGNNAAFSLLLKNAYLSTENTVALPYATKNLSLVAYGATGTAATLTVGDQVTLVAGVTVDVTLSLSQHGIAKVTD